ncbi:hypothetical protein LCGC14_1433170 [marine sediment metagenome]|uniref:Sigma-54-dependent Fis family transcriptional regulator n=1 Tax=marine sediment metagenome TaxID=412755 RepID=A0A0F9K964_9ZZZZ
MKSRMLIVEDDESLRSSLERSFTLKGYEVVSASTVSAATRLLEERNVDLLLLDLRLPDGSGIDVLTTAQGLDKETVVVILTAFPDIKTAVRAMKAGASDFVTKPFDLQQLQFTVERAIERRTLRRNVWLLERERQARGEITKILGESAAIEGVRHLIQKVADTDAPVLVTGETGTGKELVADALHRLSSRFGAPMIKVNCSALSEQLLESDLFGHEKGAFTDAKQARAGLFEMADGGTLFLDEISEMKAGLQTKLLRVVEGQPFRRVGGQREIRTNVRLIVATNRDLPSRVQSGSFREDLFYRLNTFQISVPPLRDRGSDVVLLARSFLNRSAMALRKGPMHLMPEVEEILVAYAWPGNVRELRNMMERAAILCEAGEVTAAQLPGDVRASAFVTKQGGGGSGAMPPLREIELRYAAHVVGSVGGNLSEAARILGITRNTLKAKLRMPEGQAPECS